VSLILCWINQTNFWHGFEIWNFLWWIIYSSFLRLHSFFIFLQKKESKDNIINVGVHHNYYCRNIELKKNRTKKRRIEVSLILCSVNLTIFWRGFEMWNFLWWIFYSRFLRLHFFFLQKKLSEHYITNFGVHHNYYCRNTELKKNRTKKKKNWSVFNFVLNKSHKFLTRFRNMEFFGVNYLVKLFTFTLFFFLQKKLSKDYITNVGVHHNYYCRNT